VEVSYPPKGHFDINCPSLVKRGIKLYGKYWWEFFIRVSRSCDFFEGQAERDGIDKYSNCKGCETEVGKRKREDDERAAGAPSNECQSGEADSEHAKKPPKQVQISPLFL
jgi:hypothetical protein